MFGFGDPNIYQPRAPVNPRLLKALARVCTHADDATIRHGFFEALMNSVLLIPTQPVVGGASMQRAATNFLLVEDERGQPAVCVFTDLAALQRWQPQIKAGFLSVPTPQLLRESFPTCATGLWLNIGDRASRFVSRAELAQITGGLICPTYATQVEKELAPLHAQFTPHLPATLPTGLIERLHEALRKEADVVQAYVMELDPNPRRRRLCVGLRLLRLLDDPQIDALSQRIARAANDAKLHRRGTIDVIVLDYKKHRIVSELMPPIFER